MQVRSGAAAGAAHVADHLALLHLRAIRHAEARQVRVTRRELARVRDAHDVAVAALLPGQADRPAGGRMHRRAGGRGDVHAVVVTSSARTVGRRDRALDGRRDRRRAARAGNGRGRGRCGVRLTGGRCRGRRRGVHLAADRGAGTSVALDSQLGCPPAPAVCSTSCCTCGGTFEPPSDAPLAPACREQRGPRVGSHDAVHVETGRQLVLANRRVRLRAEDAVGCHAELGLDVRDEVALAPDAQRQAALTDLDRPVGG